MPVFDFSTIGKTSTSDNYGLLSKQLDIKEKQLSADGKLSPGDYDLLTSMAQGLYAHPGLSANQRASIQSTIEGYKSDKSKSVIKRATDSSFIKGNYKDDITELTRNFNYLADPSIPGDNNMKGFLRARAGSLEYRIQQLSDSVDRLEANGEDYTGHLEELTEAARELQDNARAIDTVDSYQGGKPTSSLVAYVKTNDNGEIIDLDIAPAGSKTGYQETLAGLGGLQVYGKPIKQGDKQIFKLGNDTFSGASAYIPDPNNPGQFISKPLVYQDPTGAGGFNIVSGGDNNFREIDPNSVAAQGTVRTGDFARGAKGVLYERKEDGTYKKYIGKAAIDKEKELDSTGKSILPVPRIYESRINDSATETIDVTPAPMLPMTGSPEQGTAAPTGAGPIFPQGATAEVPMGNPRTPSPTERAPKSSQGIASRTYEKAKGFLGSLFNSNQ